MRRFEHILFSHVEESARFLQTEQWRKCFVRGTYNMSLRRHMTNCEKWLLIGKTEGEDSLIQVCKDLKFTIRRHIRNLETV